VLHTRGIGPADERCEQLKKQMRDYKILCDQSEYPSSLAVLPASRM